MGEAAFSSSPSPSSSTTAGYRLVVADEPTTGLDAFQADQAVLSLARLARGGAAVVASLHAPRSASFHRLDDVLLMAPGGTVAYCGAAAAALAWFEGLGHPCPPHVNPAEFLVDLVSVDATSAASAAACIARAEGLAAAWAGEWAARGAGLRVAGAAAPPAAAGPAEPPPQQTQPQPAAAAAAARRPLGGPAVFRLLLHRALRCAARDFWVNGTRAAASLVLGLAFGGLNARLGLSQASVARRAALLMQACINTAFLAMVKSLNGFPRERAVVARECARGPAGGGYGVLPYFLAKLCAEAPLDAAFPLLFGAVAAALAGLRRGAGRRALLATLALQGLAASALGLAVSALSPSAEAALAVGPCLMVLSISCAARVCVCVLCLCWEREG